MQLGEIGENILNVTQGVRSFRMPGNLAPLPSRQRGKDLGDGRVQLPPRLAKAGSGLPIRTSDRLETGDFVPQTLDWFEKWDRG